jgi:hypothetical protein
MNEPSPPPFIVFRTPKRTEKIERVDVYQLALDFSAAIETVLQMVDARFYLKDRLDRNATSIAMWVGSAANDLAPAGRRATYRKARAAAGDCSTILDILARRPGVPRSAIDPAQKLLAQLLAKLDHLTSQ